MGAAGHQAGSAGDGLGHSGHDRHEGHSVAMFRDKFWLTLALTVPVVVLSADIQAWLGYSIPAFPGIEYLPPSSARSSSCTAASSSFVGPEASSPTASPG